MNSVRPPNETGKVKSSGVSKSSAWSPYALLTGCQFPGGYRVLKETLEGGQSFRWNETAPSSGVWRGVIKDKVVEVRLQNDHLQWRTPRNHHTTAVAKMVEDYFGARVPFSQWADALPWRSDAHLRMAMDTFPGLRILRQPVAETLLCFLLSPLKRIPQIRDGLETVCQRFGKPLEMSLYSTPPWEQLAHIPEAELRSCGIGYRAKSIAATARFLASRPGYLENLHTLPTGQAQAALEALPGVGCKIASCVTLFSLGRMESFPVDTWIHKTLISMYGLVDFTPQQIMRFASAHFGPYAGFAQQFLFAFARS